MAVDQIEQRIFSLTLMSRRGETTAWILSGVTFAAVIIWQNFELGFAGLATALWLLFLLISVVISFGNWMDRNTVIRVSSQGIAYKNGLRNVFLNWDDIQSVSVFPVQWEAKRVQVVGDDTHFDFRTLGKIHYNGEIKGETGFADGEQILQEILSCTGLRMIDNYSSNYYYYARK